MFHVLQTLRGADQKVNQLKLGSGSDASWQLNYPFPYKNAEVIRLIHLQSYLVYLAVTAANEVDIKYNAGTAIEGIRVYKSFLQNLSADNQFYKYSQFQEWVEGIAFYTEYKMAESAASGNYQPIEAFRQLPDYKSYQQLWDEGYKNRIFLVKHAGRAALLLDGLMLDWKSRYFAPSGWLNDLLMAALGQPTEIPTLTIGTKAPDFNLTTLTGESLSFGKYRGKVVLINFMQTWCQPYVEEVPYLKALHEKYQTQGLVILGIADKLDLEAAKTIRNFAREHKINYPILDDKKGTVATQYAVSGYPHTFVINRDGQLVYDKLGYVRGDEIELEKKIIKTIQSIGK
jgi:cytochrome c biogenesis protein CcmG, thiol:disulfide interchange protein DsbE